MDEHTSLLRTFVNYIRKMFYNIVPRSLICEDSPEFQSLSLHSSVLLLENPSRWNSQKCLKNFLRSFLAERCLF
jgi:hypothetical protein